MHGPLIMKNCQFKALRNASLKSSNTKEIHARRLKVNPYGGPPKLKEVKNEQFRYFKKPKRLTETDGCTLQKTLNSKIRIIQPSTTK